MKLKLLLAGCCALACAVQVQAADQKTEDIIKARQAAYSFLAWNTSRVRANTEPGAQFNKEEVIKAANAIQAIANAGLGSLYVKGTEKGVGFHETNIKPEAFDPAYSAKLGEVAGNFNREANAMAAVAAGGDKDAVKAQLGKLGASCKGCHDTFKVKQ